MLSANILSTVSRIKIEISQRVVLDSGYGTEYRVLLSSFFLIPNQSKYLVVIF